MDMSFIKDLIDWSNANEGFVQTVYTLITGLLAWLAYRSYSIANAGLKQAEKMEIERTRPIITFDILPAVPFLFLRVKNVGVSTAYHVRFQILPVPRLCFWGKKSLDEKTYHSRLRFIEEGIASLSPQNEIKTSLGTTKTIEEALGSVHFTGKILYQDAQKRDYITEVDFDASIYHDLAYTGTHPSIAEIVGAINNLNQTIKGTPRHPGFKVRLSETGAHASTAPEQTVSPSSTTSMNPKQA